MQVEKKIEDEIARELRTSEKKKEARERRRTMSKQV